MLPILLVPRWCSALSGIGCRGRGGLLARVLGGHRSGPAACSDRQSRDTLVVRAVPGGGEAEGEGDQGGLRTDVPSPGLFAAYAHVRPPNGLAVSMEPPGYTLHLWRPDVGLVSHVANAGNHQTTR
jgi:hypothetical protein